MKIIRNIGNDRVYDELRPSLAASASLDLASPVFSLFAYAELRELLDKPNTCRIVLQGAGDGDLGLIGSDTDRPFRNRLNVRWLAMENVERTGDTTIVFRDSAFADDVAKTNLTALLQQHGLENVRSL